jgi:DNA-binding NtrC family response regulator
MDKYIDIGLVEFMLEYDWPENVSQFIGALKSAAIKSGKNMEIKIEDFPIDIQDAFNNIKPKERSSSNDK